jgi:cell division septation protein DedD
MTSRPLYAVQVGAFEKEDAATTLVARLRTQHNIVFIEEFAKDRMFYRVRVGCVADRRAAAQLEQQLRAQGLPSFVARLSGDRCKGTG